MQFGRKQAEPPSWRPARRSRFPLVRDVERSSCQSFPTKTRARNRRAVCETRPSPAESNRESVRMKAHSPADFFAANPRDLFQTLALSKRGAAKSLPPQLSNQRLTEQLKRCAHSVVRGYPSPMLARAAAIRPPATPSPESLGSCSTPAASIG